MNRVVAILGALLVVAVLSWFFPLFHVVSRETLRAEKEQSVFHADEFAKKFWATKLTPAFADAADASAVFAAYHESAEQARTQFGRTVGIGRSTFYFVRGAGTITSIDNKQIVVQLTDDASGPHVALATGLLFGNTVRDATGLLNADEFPNSQQFNEISAELNRMIEASVLPPLKESATVGAEIEFVGCAEVTNVPRDITPLKVVPLEVKVKGSP
jgi:predicted lipoprotein